MFPPVLPPGRAAVPLHSTPLATISFIFAVIAVAALVALCLVFQAARRAATPHEGPSVRRLLSCFQGALGSSVGGLVTGVLALRQRTGKRTRAVLGVVFSGLVLAVLIFFVSLALRLAP